MLVSLMLLPMFTSQTRSQAIDSSGSPSVKVTDLGNLILKGDKGLPTDVVLLVIRWDSLTIACRNETPTVENRCFTQEWEDSLLTHYEYGRQGQGTLVDITSYRGLVLSCDIRMESNERPISGSYFNKPTWLQYAHEFLGPAADSLSLSVSEPQDVLKAYYRLLGVGISSEYGWICEYSTVGSAPPQRVAAISLITRRRPDLLRRILSAWNIEGQVYAADALLYLDSVTRKDIAEFDGYRNEEIHQLDSLKLRPDIRDGWLRSLQEQRKFFEQCLLTQEDSAAIHALRVSNQVVRTCGNQGSYKIFVRSIRDVLSDSAVAQIPAQYDTLKQLGYFGESSRQIR